ncbi:membrane-anchored ubiquitin-fold protein 4-like isoform X2 [Curcuma longa]|uniref:membrane-anchored ubiquitin-fold protein 4-like isoform X2 n=1 Tax=Curcuma longa TaxID=136217 RepID=UPI003D9ECC6B
MPGQENLFELKFRLYDGSDIGPIRCASSSTVAMLKERVISEWPRDKKIIPRVATDVKLICGGKILENSKTVAQYCRSPFGEIPAGFITMHVVVQPSSNKMKTGRQAFEEDHLFMHYTVELRALHAVIRSSVKGVVVSSLASFLI